MVIQEESIYGLATTLFLKYPDESGLNDESCASVLTVASEPRTKNSQPLAIIR